MGWRQDLNLVKDCGGIEIAYLLENLVDGIRALLLTFLNMKNGSDYFHGTRIIL